jgi:hypothetical protein
MRERRPAGPGANPAQGSPPEQAHPPVARRSDAASTRSKVVLPAPEAPIKATRSPGATLQRDAAQGAKAIGVGQPTPSREKPMVILVFMQDTGRNRRLKG